MADPFVAEIRIFPFNFAPKGWAWCNGQLLPLSQNTALFSLLGTVYGGDGKSNFALPDIQGSCVVHPGQGQGLSLYDQGQTGGTQTITLLNSEMPIHTHQGQASIDDGTFQAPAPDRELATSTPGFAYVATNPSPVSMNFQALSVAGGSLPHNNLQPGLVLNF